MNRKWTREEVGYLKENYSKLGLEACVNKLNKSKSSILSYASRHHIHYRIEPVNKNHKICSRCKIEKNRNEFSKNANKKDGISHWCKVCYKAKQKQYRKIPRNINKKRIEDARYRKENKKKLLIAKHKWRKHKRATDINYRIENSIRSRIWAVIANGCKSQSSIALLGCSVQEAKQYLESRFQSGMSWDNYGGNDYSKLHWHIDHILPCDSFDLTIPEQQKICFHYTNLQPLWARDNLCKGAKLIMPFANPSNSHGLDQ